MDGWLCREEGDSQGARVNRIRLKTESRWTLALLILVGKSACLTDGTGSQVEAVTRQQNRPGRLKTLPAAKNLREGERDSGFGLVRLCETASPKQESPSHVHSMSLFEYVAAYEEEGQSIYSFMSQ